MEGKESNYNHRRKFRVVFNCKLNAPEPHRCKHCPFKTNWQVVLREHITIDHEEKESSASEYKLKCYKCEECNLKTFSLVVLTGHKCGRNHQEMVKWSKCGQCSYRSKTRYRLRMHVLRKHIGVDKFHWFQCRQCPYKSVYNSTLLRHFNAKHRAPTITKFKCEQCTFETNYKVEIRMHRLYEHTKGVVCFTCKHCSFKTLYNHLLKKHVLVKHTNNGCINLLKCEQCTFETKYIVSLSRHVKKKHGRAEDISFFCEHCPYNTQFKHQLKRHILDIHADIKKVITYNCEHCTFETKYEKSLRRHVMTRHTRTGDVS